MLHLSLKELTIPGSRASCRTTKHFSFKDFKIMMLKRIAWLWLVLLVHLSLNSSISTYTLTSCQSRNLQAEVFLRSTIKVVYCFLICNLTSRVCCDVVNHYVIHNWYVLETVISLLGWLGKFCKKMCSVFRMNAKAVCHLEGFVLVWFVSLT